jgi:rhamnopyranosyl-N-acetylglucosaminyl-diphospho-decaprenol beta-1,3/1,4-galactofuranosyltransferase
VVTCNRRELLEQCLDRLEGQSRPPGGVVVVDNGSTDGTAELLAARSGVQVLSQEENIGCTPGFVCGMKAAFAQGYEWLWLLDDDTLPDEHCLEALLDGAARAPSAPSVVASVVQWRDSNLHPMNRPWLRWDRRAELAEAAAAGLLPIRASTWVSTMFHRDAVARHGYPLEHYYVWIDDIEYSARVLRDEAGYVVPQSVVYHWTAKANSTVSDARGRFYYKVRNQLWLLRGDSFAGLERLTYGGALARDCASFVRGSSSRTEAARTVLKGLRDGMGPEPR